MLRWLRTAVLDCSVIATDEEQVDLLEQALAAWSSSSDTETDEERFRGVHGNEERVQRLELRGSWSAPAMTRLLQTVSPRFHPPGSGEQHPHHSYNDLYGWLHSVDLRDVVLLRNGRDGAGSLSVVDPVEALLDAIPRPGGVRRLLLPPFCSISQSVFERYTHLEECDMTGAAELTHVHHCAASLRCLYANYSKLGDEGLCQATRLEVLHVASCGKVTTITPFSDSLRELDCSKRCGITSAALHEARGPRLAVLIAFDNRGITSLPESVSLRELNIRSPCTIGDADLSHSSTSRLVRLHTHGNPNITTVRPFAETLRELAITGECRVADISLAGRLVKLNVSSNKRIVGSLPQSLVVLDASGPDCEIEDRTLQSITSLNWLDCTSNRRVTTVAPFAASLRHLLALGDSGALNDDGLRNAAWLVSLTCHRNPHLTTILPFAASLQELAASGDQCGLSGEELPRCIALRSIVVSFSSHNSNRNGAPPSSSSCLLRHPLAVPPELLLPSSTPEDSMVPHQTHCAGAGRGLILHNHNSSHSGPSVFRPSRRMMGVYLRTTSEGIF